MSQLGLIVGSGVAVAGIPLMAANFWAGLGVSAVGLVIGWFGAMTTRPVNERQKEAWQHT